MGAGAGSVKGVLGLAGLSRQPSVPGLSSLAPAEQKRGALSNARQCCGLMGGHRALTQGLGLRLWCSRKVGVPCSGVSGSHV